MNERIGTFCEKCREVVCRCAEHKKILDECFTETYKKTLDKTRTPFIATDTKPYGWCIEWNFSSSYFNKEGKQVWTGHNNWSLYWKHKVYPTKEVCLLALKAIKANNDSNQYVDIKYRIFPVYQGKIEEV